MRVNYTDLNRVCPKDSYFLLNIDKLVNNLVGYKLLLFMDAYSGYNQVPMYGPYRKNTSFMTEQANHQFNVMPFGLKSVCVTY